MKKGIFLKDCTAEFWKGDGAESTLVLILDVSRGVFLHFGNSLKIGAEIVQ